MKHLGQDALKNRKPCPQVKLCLEESFEGHAAPSANPARTIKKRLQTATKELDQAYWDGAAVDTVLQQRSQLVDEVLKFGWQRFGCDTLTSACLVAVGGYGRSILHPASDVDILILVNDISQQENRHLERFIAYAWDCGLNVGHSVRSLQECKQLAKTDITILSNLLDARYLIGHIPLFEGLSQYLYKDSKEDVSLDSFFELKMKERKLRYDRYGDTEYTLEPNLKESPGGLRDIHLLGLLTKREFGTHDLHVLQTIEFITPEEKSDLYAAEYWLWHIRYALHLLAQKREDRLYLDYQERLARQFGFKQKSVNLAISNFMRSYYRAANDLREITSVLFQHFRELYLDEQSKVLRPLNAFSQVRGKSIAITDEAAIENNPHEILKLFCSIAEQASLRGFVADTTRFIRNFYQHIPLVPNEKSKPLFLKLFSYPKGCAKALRLMARFGLLRQYIPEFGNITGQMQYDLYHVYTVDAHTLKMLETIQGFYQNRENTPELVRTCMQDDLDPLVLYLAALFHDIAKGQGGNHSQKGAAMVTQFCDEHSLSDSQQSMIVWLVQEHLALSSTARGQDLTDPLVIQQFGEKVSNISTLKHLTVMTIADIIATNPQLWNRWQESLVQNLFLATSDYLADHEKPFGFTKKVEATQEHALNKIKTQGSSTDNIRDLWQHLGPQYFQSETPDTIVWHGQLFQENYPHQLPIVGLKPHSSHGGTEIFIFAPDRVHLFALCAATLDKLRLSVVQARITTSDHGYCLNTFVVLESSGMPIAGPQRQLEIEHSLKALLDPLVNNPKAAPKIPFVSHHIRRQLRFFKHQSKVTLTVLDKHKSKLEVQAPDFPGLLARLGEAFIACDVFVHSAKINTLGKRVQDIFEISDRKTQQAFTNDEAQLTLKSLILDKLSAY